MKKTVIVTKSASAEVLKNTYLSDDIVAIDEGALIARKAGARIRLAISSFRTVSLETLLSFLPKDRIMKYTEETPGQDLEKILRYTVQLGSPEIVVLSSFDGNFSYLFHLLNCLKKYPAQLRVHDDKNYLTYYPEGVHILTRGNFSSFAVYGFPEAEISLEHVSSPLKNKKVSFFDGEGFESTILERIAVLKVQKGGVLLNLEEKK